MKILENNLWTKIKIAGIPIILLIIIGLGAWQTLIHKKVLYFDKKIDEQNQIINQTINQKISDIETVLLATQENNTTMAEALEAAKEKADSLSQKFDRVRDNVEDLEKITLTDPELLQKYSKVYFLNEHYVPKDLETIPSKFTYDTNKKYQIHYAVWPYLEDLLEDSVDDGLNLKVISAFRSFGEQATLKGAYTVTYGTGASQFSADQGYSEHQLGTTVDFTNPAVGATFSGFSKTAEYKWLQENAHNYGFIMSYPENNAYYQFEPWHWRFVGKKLAKNLYKKGQYFYDLGQREIGEYILYLFD
jgi:zinc D-Ala-D-Ala carboxypeptidase